MKKLGVPEGQESFATEGLQEQYHDVGIVCVVHDEGSNPSGIEL